MLPETRQLQIHSNVRPLIWTYCQRRKAKWRQAFHELIQFYATDGVVRNCVAYFWYFINWILSIRRFRLPTRHLHSAWCALSLLSPAVDVQLHATPTYSVSLRALVSLFTEAVQTYQQSMWTRQWTMDSNKMRIYWLADWLSASQRRISAPWSQLFVNNL
jgi:hypothetical protein